MRKLLAVAIIAILLLIPIPVSAASLGVSPSGPLEMDLPADGSATQNFTITGFSGTLLIDLEDIPLVMEPTNIEVTDRQVITVTLYGDGTNNTYAGKIRFAAMVGEDVVVGIKVRLTVNVVVTTEVILPPSVYHPFLPSPHHTPADTTSPTITGMSVSGVYRDEASISWTTSEPSTSQVEYWASPHKTTVLDTRLVTSHFVPLIGLEAGTTYWYIAYSKDVAGNLAAKAGTFATNPESSYPDNVSPPPVTPTTPAASDNISPPSTPSGTEFAFPVWLMVAGGGVLIAAVAGILIYDRRKSKKKGEKGEADTKETGGK